MAFSPCRNPRCGLRHDPMLRCEVAARLAVSSIPAVEEGEKAATNNANSAPDATNGVTDAKVSPVTLNRRKREDYNAYQRELMRKRRAAARAGLEAA